MTTSEARPGEAFVWVWLPGATDPVVAGRLVDDDAVVSFAYGRSYLARPDAIALYLPELPLRPGRIEPLDGLGAPGCITDAGPDSWGQRIILARHRGHLTRADDTGDLGLLTYLLESGSDRVGGLDFQTSPATYVARDHERATLAEMQHAADTLQAGEELSPQLAEALLRGTSIGGARPKVLLDDDGRNLIAKLSSTTDTYPVVKAEGVAMELARRCGVRAAGTRLTSTMGRDVLLVDRFDRTSTPGERRIIVSALTMLGLDEMVGRYATYPDLADLVRHRFTDPLLTLHELFRRIVVNVALGNTDDHARNHAAFWEGSMLTLTPAYDICPQLRQGTEANQAMAIGRGGQRESRFAVCVEAAANYLLTRAEARDVVDDVVTTIRESWTDAAEAARLTSLERDLLWGRQILNAFALT